MKIEMRDALIKIPTLCGLQVQTSLHMTREIVDWSGCRSPSRARRRMALGHPQRVVTRVVPRRDAVLVDDVMIVHPETYEKIRRIVDYDSIRH